MRHLTVYNRFAMIIAVLTVVFVAALAAQVTVLRNTVIEERRAKVLDLVEAARKILSSYEEKAKAGKISAEDARRLAFDAIGAMRWGKSADYLGIYGAGSTNAGVTYVHANPKYINVNRWDYKDNQGQLLIQNIVGKARAGGGYLEYRVPKATGGPELPKLTYAGGYGEGEKLCSTVLSGSLQADWLDCSSLDWPPSFSVAALFARLMRYAASWMAWRRVT
jgi:methyl-accepting chemotaxis protein